MQFSHKKYLLSFLALGLSACQSSHVNGDMAAFQMKSDSPVAQGGIFMRASDDSDYQAPPRQIDLVREEIVALNAQLAQVQQESRQVLNERFSTVEAWLQGLNQERQQEDLERSALLRVLNDKFNNVDSATKLSGERLAALEESQKKSKAEKNEFLRALDQKFGEVETWKKTSNLEKQTLLKQLEQIQIQGQEDQTKLLEVIEKVQKKSEEQKEELLASLGDKFKELGKERAKVEMKIANLAQDDLAGKMRLQREQEGLEKLLSDIRAETKRQEQALAEIKAESSRRAEIQEARLQAAKEGREARLMEEFELRKMVADVQKMEAKAEADRAAAAERQALLEKQKMEEKRQVLQQKVVALNEQLTSLEEQERLEAQQAEERRLRMEEELQARLDLMREEYEKKVQALKEENAKDVEAKLSVLEEKHADEMAKAEAYRTAIEERIFAMESGGVSASETDEDQPRSSSQAGLSKQGGQPLTLKGVDSPDLMVDEPGVGVIGSTNPADWVSLSDFNVVIHEDNIPLEKIVRNMLRKAEPFVGPWQVKWKLKKEHQDVLSERFSLDAETSFGDFASYISNFMRSHRGFELVFNVFEEDRVLVISDVVQ